MERTIYIKDLDLRFDIDIKSGTKSSYRDYYLNSVSDNIKGVMSNVINPLFKIKKVLGDEEIEQEDIRFKAFKISKNKFEFLPLNAYNQALEEIEKQEIEVYFYKTEILKKLKFAILKPLWCKPLEKKLNEYSEFAELLKSGLIAIGVGFFNKTDYQVIFYFDINNKQIVAYLLHNNKDIYEMPSNLDYVDVKELTKVRLQFIKPKIEFTLRDNSIRNETIIDLASKVMKGEKIKVEKVKKESKVDIKTEMERLKLLISPRIEKFSKKKKVIEVENE